MFLVESKDYYMRFGQSLKRHAVEAFRYH